MPATAVIYDNRALGLPRPAPFYPTPVGARPMQAIADALGLPLDYGREHDTPHPWKAKRLAQRAERQAREAA